MGVHIDGRQALTIGSRPCSVTLRPVDVASFRNIHLAESDQLSPQGNGLRWPMTNRKIGRYNISVGDLSFYPKGVKHGGK